MKAQTIIKTSRSVGYDSMGVYWNAFVHNAAYLEIQSKFTSPDFNALYSGKPLKSTFANSEDQDEM